MSAFTVTVRTTAGAVQYEAIGSCSTDVHMAALERFGACGVTVVPAQRSTSK
jgi:hypothetical protein